MKRIFQHARSMTSGPRSLPTNSPVPSFQPTNREYRLESGLTDKYSPSVPIVTGVCRSYHDDYATGLDDYATVGGMTPAPSSTGMIINPRT